LEAIILAGGFGTRLQPVVTDIPKSMAPVNGRPFLEFLLDYLIASGICDVVLSVGHLRDVIMNHFGVSYKSLRISYAVEEEPLGTGGGIRLALWKIAGQQAVVLNGDSFFRVDLRNMITQHQEKKAHATIALRRLTDTGRYGRVMMNRSRKITEFTEKGGIPGKGYINGGVYILEKAFLMEPDFRGAFSIEKDCFQVRYPELRMFGFPSSGYFIDIGIPSDYKKAQDEFQQFTD
jgi:D-glycero-alpha-D-manno-heptose 1-phosphate guanylyltransferase